MVKDGQGNQHQTQPTPLSSQSNQDISSRSQSLTKVTGTRTAQIQLLNSSPLSNQKTSSTPALTSSPLHSVTEQSTRQLPAADSANNEPVQLDSFPSNPTSSPSHPPPVVNYATLTASRRRASNVSFASDKLHISDIKRSSIRRNLPHMSVNAMNASVSVSGVSDGTGSKKYGRRSSSADSKAVSSSKGNNDEDDFEPIVGSITYQTPFHYVWYGCLLLVAWKLEWIKDMRPEALYLYFSTCFAIVQASRFIYFYNKYSPLPLYLSYIPYTIFVVLSREAHMLFSTLWFITIIAINLQSGANELRRHVFLSSVCFFVTYSVTVLVMSTKTSISLFNATIGARISLFKALSIEPILAEELTFLVAMLLLQLAIFMLQRFIKQYAFYLISKQKKMRQLTRYNADLEEKLKSMKTEVELDLDSPITKVIQIIKGIQQKGYGLEITENLDYAIHILTSNQLFVPNLNSYKDAIDHEVKSWLNNMLLNKSATTESSPEALPVSTANRSSVPPEVNITSDPSSDQGHAAILQARRQSKFDNSDAGKASGDLLDAGVVNNDRKLSSVSGRASIGASDVMSDTARSKETITTEVIAMPVHRNDVEIKNLLGKVGSWDFDVFELTQLTDGRPLFYLGYYLFEHYNFKQQYQIEDYKLRNFLMKVEAEYLPTAPYHNSIHAADVTQTLNYFMSTLGMGELLTPEERFASIIAACVHDISHPGVNNIFLIETSSDLAIRYNDQSVLENYHCATAFDILLNDTSCNILSSVQPIAKLKNIRSNIVKMVLATDMSGHFEYISKFKNKINGSGIDIKDPKDRQLLMDMAIKCADISNPTKNLKLCQKWADRILEEFFLQGDEEKKRGLPVSRFMDRTNTVVSKCQIGFIDYIVLPLFEAWDMYMNEDGSFQAMSNIAKNREFWKEQQDATPIIVVNPNATAVVPSTQLITVPSTSEIEGSTDSLPAPMLSSIIKYPSQSRSNLGNTDSPTTTIARDGKHLSFISDAGGNLTVPPPVSPGGRRKSENPLINLYHSMRASRPSSTLVPGHGSISGQGNSMDGKFNGLANKSQVVTNQVELSQGDDSKSDANVGPTIRVDVTGGVSQ
ncbi:hypothetical protein BKA69DRAFT_1088657 [Paraphysoderma sedebokerense]|nr:hypothetical protein BKA69DRAFT_1088657 [Paraphysoderma sedebokerense]